MNTRTLFAIGCMAIGLSTQAVGQQYAASGAAAKTLREATIKAIETNPEVQERWHAYQAVDKQRRVAKGGYYPRVDAGASVGIEDYTFDPDDGSGEVSQDFDPQGVNVTVTQLLFDGFATPREVRRLGHVRVTRYFQLLEAAEETAVETYRAYQDVLRYRQLVQLAEDNLDVHKRTHEQIKDRVDAGVGRSVDLDQATGRLALAKSNLVSEQSNLHDVSARYQRVVGEWPAAELEPAPSVNKGVPVDMPTALNFAYQESPVLIAAAEAIRAANADVEVRRSAYLPNLHLRVRGQYGNELDRQLGYSEDTVAEVVLSYNLYNGGSDRAEVRQYVAEMERAKDLRLKACRDVRQTLKIGYNDVVRIGEQLDYLNQHQASIEKAREAYRNQFNVGQRTLLDLLDTENEYFEARRAYAIGQYDFAIAHARTLAAMGRLLPELNLRRSNLPKLADIITEGDEVSVPCPPDVAPPPSMVVDIDEDNVDDVVDLCIDTPRGAAVNKAGCVEAEPIILEGVNFEFNSARLTAERQTTLEKVAAVLLGESGIRVEVAGHTDWVGPDAYNQELSQRRAQAVVDFLVLRGVNVTRMTAIGYGESQPIVSNETSEGRAQNRRVELHVLDDQGAAQELPEG